MGDPLTTGLLVAAVTTAGSYAVARANAPKIPSRPPLMPAAPKVPDVAPLQDQSRRRLAAGGMQSTILTTPLGVPQPSTGLKTTLGG